ncbi:MAG: cytochrome b N-terminal domain-containing protein [Myxococcota bacterium]
MFRRIGDWLDERLFHRAMLKALLGGSVQGGSRIAHTFGVVLLVLFLLEALTGVGLAAYYAPTSTAAWASVSYIQNQVTLGWLMRGLHHFGASAMVVVVGVHLLQTLFFAAYRSPRELNWVIGVLLLQLLVLVSHTGYLLPGDLHSYWATEVLLSITGNQPVVGEPAQLVIQGGSQPGNLTSTHLYALHAWVGPALFAGVIVLHVMLRRRQGATVPLGMSETEAAARSEPYWPHQLFKDLFVSLLVVAVLVAVVVVRGGAKLHAPADPAIEFVARPEWYMLPVFQLRHYFTGEQEFIATTVLPGAAMTFLALIPFLDKALSKITSRSPQLLASAVVLGGVGALGLGAMVVVTDQKDPEVTRIMTQAEALAEEAKRLAALGVPVTGPLELYKNDPLVWGRRVFALQCANCHKSCDTLLYDGVVCLQGYASRKWLTAFMRAPDAKHFFGNTKIDSMDAFEGEEEDLKGIVEFVYSQAGRTDVDKALAQKGAELYDSEGCQSCHSLDGQGTGDGPDLKGWASEKWLAAFIRQPGAFHFYGKDNEMDAFPHEKLDHDELSAVISYLRTQADADAKFR